MIECCWKGVEKGFIMMTSSNGNIFRVTGPLCGEFTGPGEFPTQRPVTQSFDVFFDLRLNKRLGKQPWGWWFETSSWLLWRQCNVLYTWYVCIICEWRSQHWEIDKWGGTCSSNYKIQPVCVFVNNRAVSNNNILTSNGSWRQGIKGEMTCTVYVALVWNIIYWIMMIITLFTE